MSIQSNQKLVLDAFNAIEQRNDEKFSELLHCDFEIHWPPSLPYGGSALQLGVKRGSLFSRLRRTAEWIRGLSP